MKGASATRLLAPIASCSRRASQADGPALGPPQQLRACRAESLDRERQGVDLDAIALQRAQHVTRPSMATASTFKDVHALRTYSSAATRTCVSLDSLTATSRALPAWPACQARCCCPTTAARAVSTPATRARHRLLVRRRSHATCMRNVCDTRCAGPVLTSSQPAATFCPLSCSRHQ